MITFEALQQYSSVFSRLNGPTAEKKATFKEMDLKQFFQCKKLRRSSRLEIKEKAVTRSHTIRNGPLGFFEILPLELKFHVLEYLTGKNKKCFSQRMWF